MLELRTALYIIHYRCKLQSVSEFREDPILYKSSNYNWGLYNAFEWYCKRLLFGFLLHSARKWKHYDRLLRIMKNYHFYRVKRDLFFFFFFLYLMRDCYIKIILASSFVFSLTSWQKTCKAFLNWSNFQVGNKIKLIKKSYLENFLPAQKIKSPPGIAVTDDKKPWTRKRAARSNCSNRVLKPFTSTWQKMQWHLY